jgi:hypothetical protein
VADLRTVSAAGGGGSRRWSCRGYVKAAGRLDDLLAPLAETVDPTGPEDVVVFYGGQPLVVVRPDGPRVWVRPERRPEAAA